ncbi:MAG: substrate-binding domain-containing protein [Ornithinimicrobium sp.]
MTKLVGGITDCGTYDVRSVPSAQAFARLTGEEGAPDVWIPDSAIWTDAAQANGVDFEAGPVLATSPVVLVATQEYSEEALSASGLTSGEATWAELLSNSDTSVRLGDTNTDGASFAALTTIDGQLSGGSSSAARESALVDLAQNLIAGDPLAAVEAGAATFVPASEQAVATASEDAERLTVLSPAEGVGVLTYPMLFLGSDSTVSEVLTPVLTDDQATTAYSDAGLRAGEEGAAPGVEGVPDEIPEGARPSPLELQALLGQWQSLAPNLRMNLLIDVSGSMDAVVGDDDETRMQLTTAATGAALKGLSERSEVGLRWFSTNRGPDGRDWQEEAPIRPLDEEVGDQSQLDVLLSAVEGVDEDFTTGDTGLHDTLSDGYEDMLDGYDPDYYNLLVMITDGNNNDPGGGLSEEEVVARLAELKDPDRPLDVVLLGIGSDVESEALERLADSVGGRFQQVEDENDIRATLAQLIARRPLAATGA